MSSLVESPLEPGRSAIAYRQLEVLSASAHRDLKLVPQSDYRFAARVAQVPLVAEEITEAAKHFPIVFTRAGADVQAVALLSLNEDANVFVGDDGRWQARYVPAWLRRYPFTFARPADSDASDEQLVVMIDSAAPHIHHDAGQPLFISAAGESGDNDIARGPAIDQAVDYLERYRRASLSTGQLVAPLASADLLVERSLDVFTKSRHANRVGGLQIVDRERVMRAPDNAIAGWTRSGLLEVVHAHWQSLTNFRRLTQ
ncbi:SapC family protein [Salinisphaera sp.]|uniref:SapC family protein n=1 Tax=Salinisphaera sp. TaxID=1914330 RepID=UPI0025FA22C7|nr:SapC family protein [Salinisphaera sp.]